VHKLQVALQQRLYEEAINYMGPLSHKAFRQFGASEHGDGVDHVDSEPAAGRGKTPGRNLVPNRHFIGDDETTIQFSRFSKRARRAKC